MSERVQLGTLPTPVEPLRWLSDDAWIKRDDLIHPEFGGNKIRKLERVLPRILASGAKHVVTFGAVGTNSGVAVAMVCQQFGLRCTVLLFDQPDNEGVRANLARLRHYGAELVHHHSLVRTAAAYAVHPGRFSRETFFLWAGCSTADAVFGFTDAALELKQQIDAGECPEPAAIYLPVTSGSTLAGLTLGCRMAGLNTEVRGIRVIESHLGPIPMCTPRDIRGLMRGAARTLGVPDVPEPILIGDYLGAGYGEPTPEGLRAIEQAATHGIRLEQTYSAKAFAAFLDSTDAPRLFWLTCNSRPLPEGVTPA